MTELKGKSILVVGASGVLGSLITTQLIEAGASVMACASSIESAERIPKAANPRLLLNLEDPESIRVLIEYLKDSDAPIDGIVIASGVVAFGSAADLQPAVVGRLFRINTLGPIELITGLAAQLKFSAQAGNDPFVLSISGVVAETPMPQLAAYSSAKSALAAFSQALRKEWRRDGVRVIDARPSHTETGLASRAIAGVAPAFPKGMEPSHVATRIVTAIVNDEVELPAAAFTS